MDSNGGPQASRSTSLPDPPTSTQPRSASLPDPTTSTPPRTASYNTTQNQSGSSTALSRNPSFLSRDPNADLTSPTATNPNEQRSPAFLTRRRTTLLYRGSTLLGPAEVEMTSIEPIRASVSSLSSKSSEREIDDDDSVDYSDTAKLTARRKNSTPSTPGLPPFNTPDIEDTTPRHSYRLSRFDKTRSLAAVSSILLNASTRVVNLGNSNYNRDQNPSVRPEQERQALPNSSQQGQGPIPAASAKQRRRNSIRKSREETVDEMGMDEMDMDEMDMEMGPSSANATSPESEVIPHAPVLKRRRTLMGKSLYTFGPKNVIRSGLNALFANKWTESFILLLIIFHAIVLIADAWDSTQQRQFRWGDVWSDYALLTIFSIYTFESLCRIIVSGLIFNPTEDPVPTPLRPTVSSHPPAERPNARDPSGAPPEPKLARSRIGRNKSRPTAYLRHSWNRIDFLSIVCFWIDLALIFANQEYTPTQHIFVFRSLAQLRLLRLLNVTSGSATILQSLKKSAPLLVNVGFFVSFFFVLFGIIGVQSFKGSYLRQCVWIDPDNSSVNTTLSRYCGGYMGDNDLVQSFLKSDGTSGDWSKGYICPKGQICIEGENAFEGTISFDNIAVSLLVVFIVAGVQNWTDRMYDIMDAEYSFTCIYFIVIVVVMNFWLINLFIAVITEMFAKIREDSEGSAFTTARAAPMLDDTEEGWSFNDPTKQKGQANAVQRFVKLMKPFWVLTVFADLAVMGLKRNDMSDETLAELDFGELLFTMAFAFEIIVRFSSFYPFWGNFFNERINSVDLALAVITCLIRIPPIHDSSVYPYLTAFQVIRGYRIIMAIPRLKAQMSRVLGTVSGLVNLVFFIILVTLITSIIAVQLLRGVIPATDSAGNTIEMGFRSVYNSFTSLNQIFSGENWTDVLYRAMAYDAKWNNTAIDALFLVMWFSFSNFVLLNMFIAIIMENFETDEEEKRRRQIEAYVSKTEQGDNEDRPIISRWNIYRYFKANPKSLAVENIPYNLVLPMQKNVVREFLSDNIPGAKETYQEDDSIEFGEMRGTYDLIYIWNRIKRALRLEDDFGQFKLAMLQRRRSSNLERSRSEQSESKAGGKEDSSQIRLLDSTIQDSFVYRPAEATRDDILERRALKREFITMHPMYDKSLWVFSPSNRFRRWCQLLVEPSRGERTFGTPPSETLSSIFIVIVFASVVVNVVLTAMNTPVYQKYQQSLEPSQRSKVYGYTDIAFTIIFSIEFIVRIIADGFLFTPNAYLLNPWNNLDFFVLLTLYIALFANLSPSTGWSRAFRAFKALRALRLINLLPSIKETLDAILVAGFPRMLDAAALSLCLLIPFALYGQNVFQGLFYSCNDNGVLDRGTCIGESQQTMSAPQPDTSLVYMPRVWANPYVYSFDSFWAALLILFEIVSGEGWVNVEITSMQIVGKNLNSQPDASQLNGIFFMVYNVAGSVFVLNLFLGVVIENFTKRNGTAYLTVEQRRWLDLKRLLRQVRPSKRPKQVPQDRVRKWCFDRATDKRGWFYTAMTVVIVLNIGVLCSEFRTEPSQATEIKEYIFLLFIMIYLVELMIKLLGLGWYSFRQNSWNIYDLIVVVGGAVTTLPMLAGQRSQGIIEAQKVLLTAICFKLVQKSDSLNQLFKTMAASAPQIINLLAVWFVVMTTYAILFVEIFGLTKYGSQAVNEHVNFRSFGTAFLMLVRFSTGEGWNTVMHDYTVEYPNCAESLTNYLDSDCGSVAWAYALFLSFNIISMYIFTAMFVVVVLDNFSYVYQIAANFSLVTRDEIRNFKNAWAAFDQERTGFIDKKNLIKFLRSLSGAFEVKIYSDEFAIKRIYKDCYSNTKIGIDVQALRNKLSQIDVKAVHQRRKTFDALYTELQETESPKGISFGHMLLTLAQFKLINAEDSLLIDELLQHRQKMETIQRIVNFKRVGGMLETIVLRRKLMKHRAAQLQTNRWSAEHGGKVPAIVIDDPEMPANMRFERPYSHQPGTPNTPGTPSNDHSGDDFSSPRASAVEQSRLSREMDNEFGELGTIDANGDMDDQMANQVLNSLNGGLWHDMLQEYSEE